jgi:transcriptional regulator with XRE-family HTH domain
MDSNKLLGEFLRAKREVTTPAQVGLLNLHSHRTAGLCREDVAMLAGVSTDYYIRLERGQERHPSDRVLAALIRALNLGPEAAAQLHALAQSRPRPRRTADLIEQVSPNLLQLLRSGPRTPALIVGRWMDVLATNQLAAALYDGLEYADNLLQLTFLDPAARDFYPGWEQVARARVAQLRAAAGSDLDHPRLLELVDELSSKSVHFRRMWACQDNFRVAAVWRHMRHREVGDLNLVCEIFRINSAPGQELITLQAEPDSPSENALALLGSLAAMTP